MWIVVYWSKYCEFHFVFNDAATNEIYTYLHTLSLHDALPICVRRVQGAGRQSARRGEQGRARGDVRPRSRALDDLADQSRHRRARAGRSEEHTSELQSLMRISYAVFCLKKKKIYITVIPLIRH